MTVDRLPVVELGAPVFSGGARWCDLGAAIGGEGPRTVVLTTFDAGATTVWHTHRHEQVLVVTQGRGVLDLREGSGRVRVRELSAGETVVVPAGVEHRHRAPGETPMTHVSVTVAGDLDLVDRRQVG